MVAQVITKWIVLLLFNKFFFGCQCKLVQMWPLQIQHKFQLHVSGHFTIDTLLLYCKVQVFILPEPLICLYWSCKVQSGRKWLLMTVRIIAPNDC